MTGHYKMTEETEGSGLSNLFNFAMISSTMVFVYHLITFVSDAPIRVHCMKRKYEADSCMQSWTYTHLYYPEPADVEGRVERFIVKAMSLPRNMASQRKQFYFNLFFSATTVFCFMNSTVYWFITRQHDAGAAVATVGSAVAANVVESNITSAVKIPDAPCWSAPLQVTSWA